MKIANGEQLTEQERRENVALVNAGREACEALLQRWIISGSTFFKFI
jgi:acyl CoA:acetate/3-ketoacid CoA transferase beta subunit